jgi:hypothetical protein
MNKREILNDLIKKIISCNTQHELKEIVKDINDFINDYSIVNNSNEYKRLKNAVGIMRIKLKKDFKIDESKTIRVTEFDLVKIVKLIIKEQLEGQGENPLSEKEIRLFKYLNKNKQDMGNQSKMLAFVKTMMPFVGRPESDARFYYEIYTANYRPDGDYENLDKTTFRNFKEFKQRRTPNNNAYQFSSAKIPFKGSNIEGYWDVNRKNEWYYVVKSYGWYPVYLFINNQWYVVSNTYSSSTSKQMSHANPVRYNSGLDAKVISVTKEEIQNLINGKSLDDVKSERVTNFGDKFASSLIGTKKLLTIDFGWGDNRKKVNYTITDVKNDGGKIKIDITINKAGTVEGTNKMVVNPEGYVHPSPFSEDLENGIESKIISDNKDYLTDDNTEFTFHHPSK